MVFIVLNPRSLKLEWRGASRRPDTRIGALFSGGKDSTYAAQFESRRHKLVCLVTLFPQSEMSYMFHFPNLKWTPLQAEAMGIPQVIENTPGEKEEELADLARAIRRAKDAYRLDGICTGALASVYQKSRVEKICGELGLECLSPLWGTDPEAHLRRLIDEGFISIMVSVSALGLTEDWLGRTLDHKAVDELVALGKRFKFNVGLEGGEGETFVLDSPLFSKRVDVRSGEKHWRNDRGYYEITGAALVPKAKRTGQAA